MKINPDFVSPCGLYSGVCDIYIAHRDNNQKFKERLVSLYKGGVAGKGTLPNTKNLTTDSIRYICPQCGQTVFRGAARCNQCKAALDLD